jgi:hypothetical protein
MPIRVVLPAFSPWAWISWTQSEIHRVASTIPSLGRRALLPDQDLSSFQFIVGVDEV